MHAFSLARYIVFGVVLAFALIVLGVSANFVAQLAKVASYTSSRYYYGTSFFFGSSVAGFGVATAVLTFAILIPVLVIDFLRKGAVTSYTASELGFVGFLWILWIACAGHSTSALGGFSLGDCSLYGSDFASYCSQYQALQAFSWLNWLILFFYWIALLVYALVAQSRGHRNAFMIPATDLASNLPPAGNTGGEPKIPPQNYPPGSIPPGTYPPQGYPQQSYTPSQYPQQGYTPGPTPPQGQAYQPSYASSPAPPPPNAIQV